MLELVVYFDGEMTQERASTRWQEKVVETEVIARYQVPFKWAARLLAHRLREQLNTGRCGFALVSDGKVVADL